MYNIPKRLIITSKAEPRGRMPRTRSGFEAPECDALVLWELLWEGACGFDGPAHVQRFGLGGA